MSGAPTFERQGTALVLEPGKEPQARLIEMSLEGYQGVVGGPIEEVLTVHDELELVVFGNEMGKFHDGWRLCRIRHDGEPLAGTLLVLKEGKAGELDDFTEDEVKVAKKLIKKWLPLK